MDYKDLISVIVPVFNNEKWLSRCLDSILAQHYKNFEVLLIDDGSTDASGAVCDSYARNDSRIHVIHTTNGGVSNARNIGLDRAKGDYISFVDSDDWVEPNFLEELYGLICIDGINVACTSFVAKKDSKEKKDKSIKLF